MGQHRSASASRLLGLDTEHRPHPTVELGQRRRRVPGSSLPAMPHKRAGRVGPVSPPTTMAERPPRYNWDPYLSDG